MVQTNQTNAFETTLRLDMGSTDLVAAVQSTDGSPASPCYLVIEPTNADRREYILFDGTFTADQFVTSTTANRYLMPGSAATSGIIHPAGSVVRFSPVAQHFTDIHSEATANKNAAAAAQTDIDAHETATTHVPSLGSGKLASAAPSSYPRGISQHHGTPANGWPATGPVQTIYPSGEIWISQVQISTASGTPIRRTGRNDSDVWFSWKENASARNSSYTGDGTASRAVFVSEEPAPKQVQITRRGAASTGQVLTGWANKGGDRGYAILEGGSVASYTGFVVTNSGFTVPSQINVSGVVYDWTTVG